MLDNITKIEQFKKQVSEISNDYKVTTNNNLINYILKITNNLNQPQNDDHNDGHSEQCHYETHSEGGHHDSHSDTHPDCARNSVLGEEGEY